MRLWPVAGLLLAGCLDEPAPYTPKTTATDFGTIHDDVLPGGLTDEQVLHDLFTADSVAEVELNVSQETVQSMLEFPELWQPASFRWNGLTYEVGVRVKGNGSFRDVSQKPSLKIEFDKFVPGQEFFGLDVLVLNNMISDPTKMKEVLAYRLYAEAGVPGVRANYAHLTMSGFDKGVYTMMEDVDERMLARSFDNPNGPLFEAMGTSLRPEDIALFEWEGGPDDRDALADAADDLTLPRAEALVAVEDHVDMDAFLTFYAVNGLIGQFDGWPLNDPADDVHLYVDPADNRIHFVPHGLDESFREPDRSLAIPGDSPLAEACYFTPECKSQLAARAWEVWDGWTHEAITESFAEFSLRSADAVFADVKDEIEWEDVLAARGNLLLFLDQREDKLLENLGPRP